MRDTPEVKVKKAIDKVLSQFKPACWYHKAVVNGMGKPTVDYTGVCAGEFFSIEAKAPGKKPTKRQRDTMKEHRVAGGRTFVIDAVDSPVLNELYQWMFSRVLNFNAHRQAK